MKIRKVSQQIAGQTIKDINIYSTEEKIIGTWINNKIIYRKVITCTTSSELVIAIGENIDTSWIETAYYELNGYRYMLSTTEVKTSGNNVYIKPASESSKAFYIVLNYTKM